MLAHVVINNDSELDRPQVCVPAMFSSIAQSEEPVVNIFRKGYLLKILESASLSAVVEE